MIIAFRTAFDPAHHAFFTQFGYASQVALSRAGARLNSGHSTALRSIETAIRITLKRCANSGDNAAVRGIPGGALWSNRPLQKHQDGTGVWGRRASIPSCRNAN